MSQVPRSSLLVSALLTDAFRLPVEDNAGAVGQRRGDLPVPGGRRVRVGGERRHERAHPLRRGGQHGVREARQQDGARAPVPLGHRAGGERGALRLREAARDAHPHQHGGHAREDARAPLRALPPPPPRADGLLRRGRRQQARVLPADLRAEAHRAPAGAAAARRRDAPDVRAARQGEGGRAQGGREGAARQVRPPQARPHRREEAPRGAAQEDRGRRAGVQPPQAAARARAAPHAHAGQEQEEVARQEKSYSAVACPPVTIAQSNLFAMVFFL